MAAGNGKAKTIYTVKCDKHGVEIKKGGAKEVKVSRPDNKAQRFYTGCPYCNAENQPNP